LNWYAIAEVYSCTPHHHHHVGPLTLSPTHSVQREHRGSAAASDDLVQYLEVKQQLLLSYCTNVLFYLMLKAQGKSVHNHPVMRQLLELR